MNFRSFCLNDANRFVFFFRFLIDETERLIFIDVDHFYFAFASKSQLSDNVDENDDFLILNFHLCFHHFFKFFHWKNDEKKNELFVKFKNVVFWNDFLIKNVVFWNEIMMFRVKFWIFETIMMTTTTTTMFFFFLRCRAKTKFQN